MKFGRDDFDAENQREAIFGSTNHGFKLTFGRFENAPAIKIQNQYWTGYESFVICSLLDKETGFHAAGGLCYWSLIGNRARHVLTDTQPLSSHQKIIIRKIIRSVVFLN